LNFDNNRIFVGHPRDGKYQNRTFESNPKGTSTYIAKLLDPIEQHAHRIPPLIKVSPPLPTLNLTFGGSYPKIAAFP
jgi:hypothetical protein